ncbi:transmembrane protein 79 [Salminus brasiliensis]|uniref:transmembrane protein 79 n=1 Tax=Salminus brasiliensis TaxID=930266 RepID=UPI003B82D932
MVFNPEPEEESGNSEGWTGGGVLKDGEKEEEESDRENEGKEEWEGQESRMESSRELSGERKDEVERNGGAGSLADCEDDDDDDEGQLTGAKTGQDFTPLVTIVCPANKQQELSQNNVCRMEPPVLEPEGKPQPHMYHQHPEQKPDRGCGCCSEIVISSVCLLAAAVLFALLVWAGFVLLPFKTPQVSTAPFRLVYTLRCAFFASFPIVLGVLVQGVSRFKFGALKPLFEGNRRVREVTIHGNYVRDSLHLYLLYFIQLAVMATYIHQDMLKLVPLLTIIFVFGRLIYWVCVVLGSSVRSLGFGLSFLPMLVLLGANLYFVCSSSGPEAVFDVAIPTTAPPPKLRWWG